MSELGHCAHFKHPAGTNATPTVSALALSQETALSVDSCSCFTLSDVSGVDSGVVDARRTFPAGNQPAHVQVQPTKDTETLQSGHDRAKCLLRAGREATTGKPRAALQTQGVSRR